ncbi:unnamed protein product [Durusdinium trenchii]|uniref:Kinesin motor domain-containing protein n=1 Tax=Durusdinium trenchii TaxID=1381693 RepID=A0ABP0SYS8_9DINO
MPHPPLIEAVPLHASAPEVLLGEAFFNEETSPGDSTPGVPLPGAVVHPQKWSEGQVRDWWERRTKRRQVEVLSKGTDGRNIMRWNVSRFEQMCKDTSLAMALYQDLRNEVQRFEHFRKTGIVLKAMPIINGERRPSERNGLTLKPAPRRVEPKPAPEIIPKKPTVSRAQTARTPLRGERRDSQRTNTGTGPGTRLGASAKAVAARRESSAGAVQRQKSAPRMPKPTPKPAPKPTAKPPQKTVTPLAGAGLAGAPGQAKGEKEPRRRSLVMEDLGDAMLHQLSTSAKTAEDTASPALPQEGTAQPKAVDDTVVVRRPKSARVEKVKDDDSEETRQMFDKRELRKRHKELFEQHVDQWRRRQTDSSSPEAEQCRVRVYVRKRPLFEYEKEEEEFDVATALGRKIVIHNCLTKADLRSLFISHMGFQFAHAFAESVSEDEVYRHCAADAVVVMAMMMWIGLLLQVQHMLAGKVATVFMFGQTGSGKTHTMSGLFRRAAQHIFRSESSVTLTAFEIAGKVMRDLLDQSSKELKIREDKSGKTQILGLQGSDISSPDALLSGLTQAQGGRATRATQVNETSSRSHAVFCITKGDATLTLVDCAGSERREDATQHDARSRKDAAEINSTIFALKECFRVMRSSKGQPPYRESLLTRVLADSFGSAEALVVAIGTVSPAAKDTEHSIGTLRALQQLQGTQMLFDEREDVGKPKAEVEKPKESHPKSWSETEVRQWLEEAAGGRAKQFAACVSKGTDGKNLLRWPNVRFVQLCGGDDDLGNKLYQELRVKMRL